MTLSLRIKSLLVTLALVVGVFTVGILYDIALDSEAVLWLLGTLGVYVLLIVLWFLLMPQEATAPRTTTITATTIDYPGDVHEVVDLEGIGPKFAERLHAMGIENTQQLLFTDDKVLQKEGGVPAKTVANWKAMSQLVKVNGIGPQYAEALVRSGVTGIEDLCGRDPAKLSDEVNAYLDGLKSTVIGQRPRTKRITTWQTAARKMTKTAIDLDALKVMPLESKAAKRGAATA